MKTLEQIITRAHELNALMPIGAAFFAAARESGVSESDVAVTAEYACHEDLNQWINDPGLIAARRSAHAAEVALEIGVQRLVEEWSLVTGRTGGRHSQSRHGKRRKLRAHGMESEYADKMRAEILAALTPQGEAV